MLRKLIALTKSVQNVREPNFYRFPRKLKNSIDNNVFYTPKVQKFPFTGELSKLLRFYKRKQAITPRDMKYLVECIITEYGQVNGLPQLQYGVVRDFKLKPQGIQNYKGTIDYLVTLGPDLLCPILFFQDKLHLQAGAAAALVNMYQKISIQSNKKQQILLEKSQNQQTNEIQQSEEKKKLKKEPVIRNPSLRPRTSGFSLITNGHEWQLFKVYNDYQGQKSIIFEGRNQYRNIFEDFEMVEVVLGLIDLCLQPQRQAYDVLEIAYDFLDQRRNMLEAPTKQEAQKNALFNKYAIQYYTRQANEKSK